jgi:hypothetical protein
MIARKAGPVAVPLLAAMLLAAAPAAAQEQPSATAKASRWWAGAGGGYLASRSDCSNCEGERSYNDGGALLFQGGLRASERVLVGGEVFTFGRSDSGVDVRDTFLLAIVQARPFTRHGFFLKGGYGMAIVKDTFVADGARVTSRTWGMGLMYGAGWVFGEGHRVSVAPFGAQYVTTVGDIVTQAGTAENVVGNGWFAGAVVMFR